jgi:hypothetical protein
VTLGTPGDVASDKVRGAVNTDDDIFENIIAYLKELEGFKEPWYKFQ